MRLITLADLGLLALLTLSSAFTCKLLNDNYEHMQTSYVVSTLAGGAPASKPADGDKAIASFRELGSIATDGAGNVYVIDARTLRKISPSGSVVTLFGQDIYDVSGNSKEVPKMLSTVNEGSIVDIVSLVIDGSRNTGYISAEERAIYKLQGMKDPIQWTGRMYEAEFNEDRKGDGNLKSAKFHSPREMCMDGRGNLYVADNYSIIRKISPDGKVTTVAKTLGNIGGLAVDRNGNIFASQPDTHCIVKVTPAGVVSTYAGDPSSGDGATVDGPADKARFFAPNPLTFDSQGNLYLGDRRKVRKITPAGMVSTIAGGASSDDDWYEAGFKDGPGEVALFTMIKGIACDANGNIYVTDEGRVRKLSVK
jgi:hypothetical protein